MIKYRLHWKHHPRKDQKWYEDEIKNKMMTEDEVARELDINYAHSVSGKVFSAFRPDRHIIEGELEYNPHLPVYRVWDFGKVNAILYIQQDRYGRHRILHERVMGTKEVSSNFDEQLQMAKSDANLFGSVTFEDICDPAGSWTDERGASPEVERLAEEGIYPQFRRIAEYSTRERKVKARKLVTEALQSTPGGQEALQIYCGPNNESGCPILKKAFQGSYAYKKDAQGNTTDTIREEHPYEDVIDCLLYYFLETDGFSGSGANFSVEPAGDDSYVNPYTGF